MFVLALLGVFLLTVGLVAYMGFHHRINPERMPLEKQHVIYREFVAAYPSVKSLYTQLFKDIEGFFSKDNLAFGIYYDNPAVVADKSTTRGVIGLLLSKSDLEKIQSFTAKHTLYKYKELPATDAARASFIYRNQGSLVWGSIKVCPALHNYIIDNKLVPSNRLVASVMEVYHWNDKPKTTEYIIPFGDEAHEYRLTTAPPPARRMGPQRKE